MTHPETIKVHCHLCDCWYELPLDAVQTSPTPVAEGALGVAYRYVVCPRPDCGVWLPIWPRRAP